MKKGILALITAVLLGGMGVAQAAVTTNYYEDFTVTPTGYETGVLADLAMTNGMANEVWWFGNNGNGIASFSGTTLLLQSKKDDSGAAYYTLPSATLGEAATMSLTFDVSEMLTHSLYVIVYGIENPGTATDHVAYDALNRNPGGFEVTDMNLTAVGSANVTVLANPDTYTAAGVYTVNFNYNGTDDVVIGFAAEMDGYTLKNTTVDSVLLTSSDEVSFPAEVSLVSGEMVFDAENVTTGTVAVSYAVGSANTNVAVTSVSVIDQTHASAFANASTNLPLTLAAPDVPEDLLVTFDNTTAGLAAGETATGVVQVVWNEVGSATISTSTVPVSATRIAVNEGNTIAIFDHDSENASPRLGGLTAKIYSIFPSTARGSTDGSYGSLPGNARTDEGCHQATINNPVISVAITNETGYDCTFDSLHFDAAKGWAKGPGTVTVSISGDVTAGSLFTNETPLEATGGAPADYADFDIDLTNLADRTLANGETALIEFTFSDGDPDNYDAVSCLDNIALLGSGQNGATLSRIGGAVNFGVVSSDTTLSELIQMSYEEGDAATNVVITGVSVSNITHASAFSAMGSFPQTLLVAGATNDIFSVQFDNTVAVLAAGETASALVEVVWNEAGVVGSRTVDFNVTASRPADVPEAGVVALFDTDFRMPDAAMDGILGNVEQGRGLDEAIGSSDGTYGTLASPVAPTNGYSWGANFNNPVVMLTVTNKSAGDVVLSSLNFDIGRRWLTSPTNFTLSVSGGVTADPELLRVVGLPQQGGALTDFQDYDVSLTHLADHTLATGESIVFTFTFDQTGNANATYLDNIALMTLRGFDAWAADMGLTPGVNDALTDNPDGDGRDNLMEYATNGDPLTADMASMWQAEEGGTNWFYHVHEERTDDASLTFTLDMKGDLMVSDPDWSSAGLEFVGESGSVDGFKSVTNRTDLGNAEFIRLQVEKN